MTITFPRTDIFDLVPIVDVGLSLFSRQELSRQAGGTLQGKDLGSPIWRAKITSALMPLTLAGQVEARLDTLQGVINPFEIYSPERPFPQMHSDGGFADTAVIASITDNKLLTLSGLPAGFVLAEGDFMAFDYGSGPSRAFHRIVETVQANATGLSPKFQVVPHIRAGAVTGAIVTLAKPRVRMVLEPNSVRSTMRNMVAKTVTFSAVQVF